MTNAQLFKQAHAMTKQVIKTGDCYRTTFGACLKAIKADIKQTTIINANFIVLAVIILSIIKTVDFLKDLVEPMFFFGVILFNPFSLMIYNGIYLAILGG